MKRLTAAVIVALFVIANPSLSSAAGTIDEQYSINNGADNRNKVGVFFEENVDTLRMPSLLFSYQIGRNIPLNVVSYCTGLNDPACDSAEFMKYYALMPPCKSLTEVDCIESIYAVAPGSRRESREFIKNQFQRRLFTSISNHPITAFPKDQFPVFGRFQTLNMAEDQRISLLSVLEWDRLSARDPDGSHNLQDQILGVAEIFEPRFIQSISSVTRDIKRMFLELCNNQMDLIRWPLIIQVSFHLMSAR